MQNGPFNQVIKNLQRLQGEKIKRGLNKPVVTVVYALNKLNINEVFQMIDLVSELHVEHLKIYHYRDYGFNEIALDRESAFANELICNIYAYARDKGVEHILPRTPPFFKEYALEDETEEEIKCYLPWTGLQMRSCYSHSDSYFVGCCNVFNAFLFNYNEHINKHKTMDFKAIWHHPVLQFLRKTVNSHSDIKRNPLCKYCKSKRRHYLKNVDNKQNYLEKTKYLHEFYELFDKEFINVSAVEGLTVLKEEAEELKALV